MFFLISKQIQSSHRFDTPNNSSDRLMLDVCRTNMRTALFSVNSSKAFVEFRDEATRKVLPKRTWSADMKAAAAREVASAGKPPFVFKLTIVGWVFAAAVVALLGFLTYDSLKSPPPPSPEFAAMLETPAVGDIYFGSYDAFKERDGKLVPNGVGFCWFKIVGVEGDRYDIARSTDVSSNYRPKEELKNETFATEAFKMKITEQQGYALKMQTDDGTMKVYFTDKK